MSKHTSCLIRSSFIKAMASEVISTLKPKEVKFLTPANASKVNKTSFKAATINSVAVATVAL